jgi:hypothetical protein
MSLLRLLPVLLCLAALPVAGEGRGLPAGAGRMPVGALPLPLDTPRAEPRPAARLALPGSFSTPREPADTARSYDTVRDSVWRAVVLRALSAPAAAERPAPRAGLDVGLVAPLPGESGGLRTGELGELAVRARGRTALGGAWDRAVPCSQASPDRCQPGAVPQLLPDLRLAAELQGTLFGRLHVDVDYDAVRERSSANRVHVRYVGAPGEALRTVEVGSVALSGAPSRYLAQAVPPAELGVRMEAALGGVRLEALWAEQGGGSGVREFRGGFDGGLGRETVSAWDDAAYAAGQFFFLVDPGLLRGYPHVDVLDLTGADAPGSVAPAAGIRLYRYAAEAPAPDGSTPILIASPRDPALGQEAVRGAFRLLQEGRDYHLHPSGLWVALRTPLREDEALGTSYHARDGSAVGDAGSAVPREIVLLRGVRHLPGSSTWALEMRQVYRVAVGAEVDANSVRVSVSRGDASGGDLHRVDPRSGEPVPYLELLGLDTEAPRGEVDAARLFRPGDGTAESALHGVWLVFPTLEPFARPPPLRARGLDDAGARALLGEAANPELYLAADDRSRRGAARFRLEFRYSSRGDPAAAAIHLGAVSIREGSERVWLGGRLLERGVDYEIFHDLAQLRLLGPAQVAAREPGAHLRATFEEPPLFRVPAASVLALSARRSVGDLGEVRLLGVTRTERPLERRPQLGAEPTTLMMGGVGADLTLPSGWLDRVLGTPPGGSELRIAGEWALSAPDPRGTAVGYIDDFEDEAEIPVPLVRQAWRLGSAPLRAPLDPALMPGGFDPASAAPLAWQHEYRLPSGKVVGPLRAAQIDAELRVAGAALEAPLLHLTLAGEEGVRGWRSVTTVLAARGRDLRQQEFLEVYVRGGASGDALVLDLGTVSEDALASDAEGRRGGTDDRGHPWGEGVLDQEWDPEAGESWTAAHDRRGLWNARCEADPGTTYPLGDLRATCTRGNGLPDTEDLNGNGVLDTDERALRYVVRLGDPGDPHLVRDTTDTGTPFRLYRIPLRRGAEPGSALEELRAAAHLRVTVIGTGRTEVALARMRLVGSGWEKPGQSGIARGLTGEPRDAGAGAVLEVGAVSRRSVAEYISPPGVREEPRDPRAFLAGQGAVEYGERALRLRYAGLDGEHRAEAVRRFDDAPRNFLPYRELRVWALSRAGRWGAGGESLLLRVGSDPDNAYLRLAPLPPGGAPRSPADWTEVVVRLERWIELRAEAERRLMEPGVRTPVVVWDEEGTHGVVLSERGRAPNLAAVREVAVGVWNGAGGGATGEVWLNELRLTGADRTSGSAGDITLTLRGGGLLRVDASHSGRGARFQEAHAGAEYRGDGRTAVTASLEAGALLPDPWGVRVPIRITHARSAAEPLYLDRTDVRAGALGGIRPTGGGQTRLDLEVFRDSTSAHPLARVLVDPLRLRVGVDRSAETLPFTGASGRRLDARLHYLVVPDARSLRIPRAGTVRWSPTRVSLGTGWTDGRTELLRYAGVLRTDTAQRVHEALQRRIRTDASLALRPLESLDATVRMAAGRDLLDPERQNPALADRLSAERRSLLGLDLGRERDRTLDTDLRWAPRPTAWLHPRLTAGGSFAADLDPAYLPRGDSGDGELPGTFQARRDLGALLRMEPARLVERLSPLRAVEIGWSRGLESRFERVAARPGLLYGTGFAADAAYLTMDGDTAAFLRNRTRRHGRAEVVLPGALRMAAGVSERNTSVRVREERVETERELPSVTLDWEPSSDRLPRGLSGFALGGGVVHRTRSRRDAPGLEATTGRERALPLRISLRTDAGVGLRYRGEWRVEDAAAPWAATRRASLDHGISLEGAVATPGFLRPAVREPLGLSLEYVRAARRDCRLEPLAACGADDAFGGYREEALRLQVNARAEGMDYGLHLEYRDREGLVGERPGSSRLFVGLFGEFTLSAGTVR